jgi:energy-coupling factor transporter ATP-binding protein EcfA2
MGNQVLIIGRSGSGKSTSLETLDPKSTFIVNALGKPLPFKGWKSKYSPFSSKDKTGNLVNTFDANIILQVMDIVNKDLVNIKSLVIEDVQYVSACAYMDKIEETGYSKFNKIGKNLYLLMTKPKEFRDDLTVFYLNHEDEVIDEMGNSKIKAKTIGKMIDNLLSLEGLFTVVLHASNKKTKEGVKYFFETQTDGSTTAKSPRGMFDTMEIPNDLELVRKSIISYNE